MNIRRKKFLRRKSWFGKLLRLPFKLIPANAVVSILSGPLKGKKWIKGAHNVSILFGAYEKKQTESFRKRATASNVLWDLGSHVGYYSLLFNAASPKGKIFAFEPVSETAETFKKHMSLNNITDYKIFTVAVSDKEGSLSFNKTSSSVAGKLDESGETKVDVIRLSKYLAEGKISSPDMIKMDIEGAEVGALNDLKPLLKEKMPVMFVSTHGKQIHLDCLQILKEIGYRLEPLDTNDLQSSKEILAYK